MSSRHGKQPDLSTLGIHDTTDILYNPDYDTLFQEETAPELEGYERGTLTQNGAVAVDTGIFTGRSPKDKYIVRDATTQESVWWSDSSKGKMITSRCHKRPGRR